MIVSNASPLIYLAKIGRLDLLKQLYASALITEAVKQEVVDKGKQLGKADAYAIEKALSAGWLKTSKAPDIKLQIELEEGEKSTISLACSLGESLVLIDEAAARAAARLVGLEPRGTVFVLLKALQEKLIDFDLFLDLLQRLVMEGFWLKEEVYIEVIKQARKLAAEK
ncbi:MAG: DUF3368 domain-containing protein [Candidatus Aenigmarchaeota archaeon]|nr:DUF3368 domain-containing protein [Candidatus Aenigmarchaeota archaeon]